MGKVGINLCNVLWTHFHLSFIVHVLVLCVI
jgi:hypothetical protein